MKVTDAFRDAEALAAFANLDPENASAVTYFRNNYPEFAPSEWWDYKFEEMDWVPVPEDDLDFKNFGVKASVQTNPDGTIAIFHTPVWQDTQESVQRAWGGRFQFENVFHLSQLLKMVFTAPAELVLRGAYLNLTDGQMWEYSQAKLYGYHQAVLYLYEHPNQAKICTKCGKYFVTARGKREYCLYPDERGETCSQKQIAEQHLEWWRTKGDAQRKAKKRKAKRKQKRPKSVR